MKQSFSKEKEKEKEKNKPNMSTLISHEAARSSAYHICSISAELITLSQCCCYYLFPITIL